MAYACSNIFKGQLPSRETIIDRTAISGCDVELACYSISQSYRAIASKFDGMGHGRLVDNPASDSAFTPGLFVPLGSHVPISRSRCDLSQPIDWSRWYCG